MTYEINPLTDARWPAFVNIHPDATIFHTREWLQALHRTYGYEPVVLTNSAAGETLNNALLFCRIDSWLTGRRWVSLPFSDHCDPLISDEAAWAALVAEADLRIASENLRYLELRPLRELHRPDYAVSSFCFHQLDLTQSIETLYSNLHAASVQRKIRRAEREGLVYLEGNSAELIDRFYQLLLITRKRHAIPPQPRVWFQNLTAALGATLQIRLALKDDQPIAAILTLRHRKTMVYKYGCSDERFHPLGGMQLLMWRAIQNAKDAGLTCLDLGRSDLSNSGLITYKDRWGAEKSHLSYLRRSKRARPLGSSADDSRMRLASAVFRRLPSSLSTTLGGLFYRHIG